VNEDNQRSAVQQISTFSTCLFWSNMHGKVGKDNVQGIVVSFGPRSWNGMEGGEIQASNCLDAGIYSKWMFSEHI